MARSIGARRLHIMFDSKLVVGKLTGEYETKNKTMKRYQKEVRRKIQW